MKNKISLPTLILFLSLTAFNMLILVQSAIAQDEQITNFSEEVEKFPDDLMLLLKDQFINDDEFILRELLLFWKSDSLTIDQKKEIVSISNELLQKSTTSKRYFIAYAQIILDLPKNQVLEREYVNWSKGLQQYAQDNSISITWISEFLNNSLSLFKRNVIFKNPSYEWKGDNDHFRFRFDKTLTLEYDNTNLICTNSSDSISILSTSGVYFPLENRWKGKGGKVTWARSKLPENEIFAVLNKYSIDLTKSEYQADSAWFTNMDYFKEPALGQLKDKAVRSVQPENIPYPEFRTYGQRYRIENLFEGVDYDGGYFMMGGQLIGSGTPESPARFEIRKNNKEFLRIESKTYIFRRQVIVSDNAQVRFKLGTDSLFHTGLGFTYNNAERTLNLSPTEFLTTKSPISSTYHKFSITFGQITWKIDQDELTFGPPTGSAIGQAMFESNNYFNEDAFDYLMGLDQQHPLFAVANFTIKIKSRIFNASDFAFYMKKSEEQTRIQLMRLAMLGYVFYNAETGEAQALPKLYDAIRAKDKRIDYDVIKFSSSTNNRIPNAVLNLNTFEMAINGVENISVSDSQNVHIYPARKQLILKKNRDFAFDGVVRAGLFTFFGKDFDFDYTNFKFELKSIDSLKLDYQTAKFDFYGRKVLNTVTSTFEMVTGEILIDKPNNKSGLLDFPDYPIFKSTKNSFVYYDDKFIHNGIYSRDKFFFEVYPFVFKNINNFSQNDMNFLGILYSADIFAPIEDTLILRPDNSLGFIRNTDENGIAIYQGKGRFFNNIDLSNQGLRGEGKIAYITSITTSDNLYFFPDSTGTISTEFTIARQDIGIQYPEVKGTKHLVKWQPYKDILWAYKGDKPFDMYSNQAKLTGNLTLEPLGLIGDGLMDVIKGRLKSIKYEFNALDFKSDIASIEIDAPVTNEVAFVSDKVKAFVSFKTQKGEFNKIDESIFAHFEPVMYKAHMDKFTWDMIQNDLTLATEANQEAIEAGKFHVRGMADKDTIPRGSLFYSIHRDEDSLYFFAPRAKYNLTTPGIKADSVKYLLVADAVVYPNNKIVEVDSKKRMLPLHKAKIIANLTNKYHSIYNAEISVTSRNYYFGNGLTDYIDEQDSIQTVALKEIKVNNQGNTYALATVTEPDSFKLSPVFAYAGEIELFANEKFWTFNGGTKPLHSCVQIPSSWLKFKATIDPKNILIPIDPLPVNLNLVYLMSGSVINSDSVHLYPALVSGRKEYQDKSLISASGYLQFNRNNSRFQIGSMEKLQNPDTTGNLISLNKEFCMIFSDGTINFPINLGQIGHKTIGSTIHKIEDSTLTMDVIQSLDFHFNQKSLEAMASEILVMGLPSVDLSRKIFTKALFERVDALIAQAAINQIKLFGSMSQLPKGLESTITFTDLKMRWDPVNRSFVSYGKIGIGTLGNIQVNKRVDGYIEIIKRGSGDLLMMYFQLSSDKYYYFYYTRGTMQVSSHNPLFTDPIDQMKTKERRVKVKPGQIPFNFVVGTKRELARLRDRYAQLTGTASTDTSPILEEEENP